MEKKVVWRKPPPEAEIVEARCAMAHGHFLYVSYDARTNRWYKAIDHSYRGGVESLELAKTQLLREAAGEADAWGNK
jgi:hypothetical protein